MNKYLLMSALIAAVFTGAAADSPSKKPGPSPLRVRTGVIANVKFTAYKPETDASSPAAEKSSPAWAVVTLALDRGRAGSIFDYVLRRDGIEYPCLDMAEDGESFHGRVRNYSSTQDGKKCRLLFAVPNASSSYEIIFKLLPGKEDPVRLK